MKKSVKVLSLILSLAMVFSLLISTSVFALDYNSGKGDPEAGGDQDIVFDGSFGTKASKPRYTVFKNENISGQQISDTVSWHNGAIYDDGKSHTITNTSIIMDTKADGSTTNDFSGLGAAVISGHTGTIVQIENSYIETTGVAKLALFTDDGAISIVKNSTLKSNSGTIYKGYYSTADQTMMVSPPWVLGLGGAATNARTTNLMGNYSVAIYIDSSFYAAGWGALSVDSGSNMHMVIINCDVTVPTSGYGAYTIGETVEEYYGVKENVCTYANIMTGGEAVYGAYTGGSEIAVAQYDGVYNTDQDKADGIDHDGNIVYYAESAKVAAGETITSTIVSDNFGFMCHANGSSGMNRVILKEGTSVTSDDAVFLVKKINADIILDNSTIESTGKGVLLQIIDNDDDYVGTQSVEWGFDDSFGHSVSAMHMPTFNTTFHEDPGYSNDFGTWKTNTTNWTVDFTMTNMEATGDLWNSTGYVGSNTATALTVTLGENAVLTGSISAGAFSHDTKDATVGDGNWDGASALGHVTNIVNSNGYNLVNVVLTDNAVWNVNKSCYIDTLSIKDKSHVIIPDGVTLTVGGVPYTGTTLGYVFTDVNESNTFHTEIVWAYANGIAAGFSDGSFRPWATCNRAAYVVFLWNQAGSPAPNKDANAYFSDVYDASADFNAAIAWGYETGVVTGYSDGTYRPWNAISRSAAITMLYRYYGKPATGGGSITFTDLGSEIVPGTDVYNAILWAQNKNVAMGYSDGTLKPYQAVNRASMITFIYRLAHMGLEGEKTGEQIPSEV